jgi:hypothetical protein
MRLWSRRGAFFERSVREGIQRDHRGADGGAVNVANACLLHRIPAGAVATRARKAHRRPHHRHHPQCRRYLELRQETGTGDMSVLKEPRVSPDTVTCLSSPQGRPASSPQGWRASRVPASGLDRMLPSQQRLAKQASQIRRAHPSERSVDGGAMFWDRESLLVRPAQTARTNARLTITRSPDQRRHRANLPLFLVSFW